MLPRMCLVRQETEPGSISDPGGVAAVEIAKCNHAGAVATGERVAIAVGSRGIHGIGGIVASVVKHLRSIGAEPFVFPAMGCHGGATGHGQKATLDHLGVSERTVGCPVLSDIEPVQIGTTRDGVPVYLDANARRAEHLMVINRIKPHSDFFGTIGSGLLKMLVIGCGKAKGADATHEAAIKRGLEQVLRAAAAVVLAQAPVLGGLAVVEGPTGRTMRIEWVPAAEMPAAEPSLFRNACELAPAIPLPCANLLVVDWAGKNISGCGVDPFVIGRQEYLGVHDSYTDFRADRVYVRDLTDESLGNADGIGMADATTQRLVSKLDYDAIRIGVLTSRTLPLGRIPIAFPDDREAIDALLGTTSVPRADATVVRIKNTVELEYLEISENLLPAWERSGKGRLVGGPYEMGFDGDGNLLPFGAPLPGT